MKKGKGLLYVAEKIRYDKKRPFLTFFTLVNLIFAFITSGLIPLITFFQLSPAWIYTYDKYNLRSIPTSLLTGGTLLVLSALPALLGYFFNNRGKTALSFLFLMLSLAIHPVFYWLITVV